MNQNVKLIHFAEADVNPELVTHVTPGGTGLDRPLTHSMIHFAGGNAIWVWAPRAEVVQRLKGTAPR
jgi:hypothetical protein